MIKLVGFAFFLCSACPALAIDREFGHPLFRTFTARDYGEVGQIFAVTEDARGRMLFGCGNAIVAFDNNHWETIPAPGTGFIRSLAVDSHGVVWFSSSNQIGYLSRVDGECRAVKVYNGVFLLDQEGHLVESYTVNTALADASFLATGEDRDGGLWVCTDTQTTRIQCGVGCSEFDH